MSGVSSSSVAQRWFHVQSTHSSLLFGICVHMHGDHALYFMFEDAVAQRSPLIAFNSISHLLGMRLAPEHGFSDSISIWTHSITWKIHPCPLNILSRESETALAMWISNSILFNNHKNNWILIYLWISSYKNHPDLVCFLTYVFPKCPTAKELGKCQFHLVNYLLIRNLKSPSLERLKLGSVGPPPAPPWCWGQANIFGRWSQTPWPHRAF